jgi:hypothetical protein
MCEYMCVGCRGNEMEAILAVFLPCSPTSPQLQNPSLNLPKLHVIQWAPEWKRWGGELGIASFLVP